ncbi:hypothetical protein [Nostoc sp. 'Peltigera membranacea cyanobiont' 213]|uniref:hypothetical protein n=1 Tax=Nostoc sp. 'Peltigera membranacea cyanobiont' 213 TaxID=2014530 RepID=UPI001CB94818|nr:hypothetical protein [Nostoc sp. 'Peltigera membranacea cyanobiont' 213]
MSDDFVLLGGNGDCLKPCQRYFDFGVEGGNNTNNQARKIIPPSGNNKQTISISIIFTLPLPQECQEPPLLYLCIPLDCDSC